MSSVDPDRTEGQNEGDSTAGLTGWGGLIEQAVNKGDLAEFVEAIDEIQSMGPRERFTRSAGRLHSAFSTERDETLSHASGSAGSSPVSREMYKAFDELWSVFQRTVFQSLQRSRRDEKQKVLLGIYLEKAQEAFLKVDEHLESGKDVETPLSTFITLSGRLIQTALRDGESLGSDLFRDVLRADFYLAESDSVLLQDPEELSREEAERKAMIEGSVLLYENENISVGRGAELAGVQLRVFEEALESRGIRPNYGPENLDDLASENEALPDTDR